MAQTADGLLWLGGHTGLFTFDGLKFARFEPATGSRLLSTNIYSLLAMPGGGLWVGYAFGGASLIENGHVHNYNDQTLLAIGSIHSFAQHGTGPVWALSAGGLARFDGLWERVPIEGKSAGDMPYDIKFDRKGVLWLLVAETPDYDDVRPTTLLYLKPGERSFRKAGCLQKSFLTLDPDGLVITTANRPQHFLDRASDLPSELPVLQSSAGNRLLDRFGYL